MRLPVFLKTVLHRHGMRNNAEGSRVVAADPSLSAKLTAHAVIEGRCAEVAPFASSQAAAGDVECVTRSERGSRSEVPLGLVDEEAEVRGDEGEKQEAVVVQDKEGVKNARILSSTAFIASRRRESLAVLAKAPVRGFHLVDLHAVVRNCVEWHHCLPKV